MNKRKVQSVIFYCDSEHKKHFLLLKVNEKRGLFWQNSTGSVEDGESFEQGAIREAIEETALENKNIDKVIDSKMEFNFDDRWGYRVREKIFFIKCFNKWDITLDPSEHVEFVWVNEDSFSDSKLKYKSNTDAVFACMEASL